MRKNFCLPEFLPELLLRWPDVIFRGIYLDYFWIPCNSWQQDHWKPSFFREVIPGFVTKRILHLDGDDECEVVLPFTYHCVREVAASIESISKYYAVSFIRQSDLAEYPLWAATNAIDKEVMQGVLAKEMGQEELYCKVTNQDHVQASEVSHITKENVLKVLQDIKDVSEVRMIKLTVLKKYNSASSATDGGFVGLHVPVP